MTTNPPSLSRALYAQKRAMERRRSICGGYATYECRKSEWASSHPDATSAEYDAAMNRIARECGV